MSDDAHRPPKREREEAVAVERSAPIYVQCKHISKPWELLNVFMVDHRKAIGLDLFVEPAASHDASSERSTEDVSSSLVLKRDAPVEVAYAFWSRKPFYLVEFTGDRRAILATNLLSLAATKPMFRGMPVVISAAKDTSVDELREKMQALGGVPKHGDEKSKPAAPPAKVVPVPEVQPEAVAPKKPSATSFVPRACRK